MNASIILKDAAGDRNVTVDVSTEALAKLNDCLKDCPVVESKWKGEQYVSEVTTKHVTIQPMVALKFSIA